MRSLCFLVAMSVVSGSLLMSASCSRREADGPTSVGIPECDQYLETMEKCAANAPLELKGPFKRDLEASREKWLKAAAEGRGESIRDDCKAALKALLLTPTCTGVREQ